MRKLNTEKMNEKRILILIFFLIFFLVFALNCCGGKILCKFLMVMVLCVGVWVCECMGDRVRPVAGHEGTVAL